MNILPMVIAFLTILALTSYGFFHNRQATHQEEISYRGYMRAQRLARNRSESREYKEACEANLPKKPKASSKLSTTEFVSWRTKTPAPEVSRLNISQLFLETSPPKLLYETAASLIEILYKQALFKDQKDFEYQLLDLLIEKGKQKPHSLAELLPEDPKYRDIFYKMARGTNIYKVDPVRGYPPFEDFFTFEKKGKAAASFPYASKPLLKALFGPQLAEAIVAEEEAKWEKDHKQHPLKQKELEDLVSKDPKYNLQLAALKELLEFSTKRLRSSVQKDKDKTTQITIRTKIVN